MNDEYLDYLEARLAAVSAAFVTTDDSVELARLDRDRGRLERQLAIQRHPTLRPPPASVRPHITPDDTTLAKQMRMPRGRKLRVYLPGERYGQGWAGYVVELFGIVRTDEPVAPSRTGLLYVERDGRGRLDPEPVHAPSLLAALEHYYAERSPEPAELVLEVWQRVVWYSGASCYLEWRWRPEEVNLRGLLRQSQAKPAEIVLRGRRLLRAALGPDGATAARVAQADRRAAWVQARKAAGWRMPRIRAEWPADLGSAPTCRTIQRLAARNSATNRRAAETSD